MPAERLDAYPRVRGSRPLDQIACVTNGLQTATPCTRIVTAWWNRRVVIGDTAMDDPASGQNGHDGYARRLIRALGVAGAAGVLGSPETHAVLLESVVQTAADVIGAKSAALFLIDQEAGDLIFEVALGPKGAEVKKLRVPLGKGIAGLVAVSGQAMAVADIANDPRHARDIADAVEYRPKNIVCVPLTIGERIIGVLELLDKIDAPAFSAKDITLLGMFAGIAATAIEQSRTHHNLAPLVRELTAELDGDVRTGREEFVAMVNDDPAYRASVDLATIVSDIVWRGEAEREACRALLEGFRAYLDRTSGARA
jgi:signal transduction protein with GAF and PtsI domain